MAGGRSHLVNSDFKFKPNPRTTQSPWKTDCTLKYPDQDILNVVFDGKILELPLRYNTFKILLKKQNRFKINKLIKYVNLFF